MPDVLGVWRAVLGTRVKRFSKQIKGPMRSHIQTNQSLGFTLFLFYHVTSQTEYGREVEEPKWRPGWTLERTLRPGPARKHPPGRPDLPTFDPSAADRLGSTATLGVRSSPTLLRRELQGAHSEPGSHRPQEQAAAAVLSAPSPGGTRDHRHTACGAGRLCAAGAGGVCLHPHSTSGARRAAPKTSSCTPPPLQRRDHRLRTTPRLHTGPARPNLPQLGHKGGSHIAPADSLVCWRPALRISAWDGDALQEGTR
ncbi:hypothetical protein NDU88_003109 [Pleurodeles waltl]|uniref:Uncharacterized protein n=1 Tax=Pleurodeles waltl TaxID=8319 RepID=A0AAV7MA37_PLEWA|nr:hypothetical protein NDU88_003109 [Pleurodeles waltl]